MCLALVENHDYTVRVCKNNAEAHHVCHSHKDYNFREILYKKNRNPINFLQIRTKSVRHVVEEWIRLGLICITPRAFAGFIRKELWAYFWMLCSRHTSILPEWNPQLYRGTIEQMFRWWNVVSYGPSQVYNADILRLICVKGRCELFYQGLFYFPAEMIVGLHDNDITKLLDDASSLHPEWFLEFWMSGEHTKQIHESKHPISRILENVWVEKLFAQKRAEFYKRSLPFREELLALIYASAKRTVDWTMDWREARDLKQRWKLEGQ